MSHKQDASNSFHYQIREEVTLKIFKTYSNFYTCLIGIKLIEGLIGLSYIM